MRRQTTFAALAARRLAQHRAPAAEAQIQETVAALRAALVRLDWCEARRQADQLHALGGGRRTPMTQQEQEALHAKVAKLVEDVKAHPIYR